MEEILYTIYDIFLKKEIHILKGKRKEFAKSIGCYPEALSHLISGRQQSIKDRYILPENKHLIFTFVDNDGNEYPCITNKSLFIQLNREQTQNEIKYVSAVRYKKYKYCSLGDKLYHIKEDYEEGQYPTGYTKAMPDELKEIRKYNKRKQIVARRLRIRLIHAIRAQLADKRKSAVDMLGIPLDEFFVYIENQFMEGMSWDNYGEWHIDHIKPCSKFDLFLRSEQEKCFHYTNLQPLWATDNYKKHNTYFE